MFNITHHKMGKAGGSRIAVFGLLFLVECLSVPVPCGELVGHLQKEIQKLEKEVQDQQQYIQELQHSQAQRLPQIPITHLQAGDHYKDCSDVLADGNTASGLYVIRPGQSASSFMVFCDMSDGGGWTVFQRRTDGKESFDRGWVEYKHGFGDIQSPNGEFWLGNDPLHHLTSQGNYDLRINLEDFEGKQRFAKYNNFKVDDEKDQYQLHLGEYTGNAGDALSEAHPPHGDQWNNLQKGPLSVKFSTYDHPNKDNDAKCVRHDRSGWWFSRCESGNLNGHYYNGPSQFVTDDGVVWFTWHGWWYSMKSVVMMIRASDVHPGKLADRVNIMERPPKTG